MFINNPLLRQYAVVIAVNLMIICTSMDTSWSSPVLVKLRDPAQSPFSRPITEDEVGWIVSIGYLFTIFTVPCMGILMDYIGRKYSILVICLPKIIAGVLTIFATEVWLLLVARAINLTMNAAATTAVIIYSTEIASKEIRGSLGSIITICYSLGGLAMMGIGPYISYLNLNILVTTATLCAYIPLLFIPDTPYSLYNKGEIHRAKNVLKIFRGSATLAEEELKEFSKTESNQKFDKKEIFKNKVYLKAVIIIVVMGIGVQFTGYNFIWLYLQTILDITNTNISSALCSLIIGLIQALAGVFAAAVSDRFGRRPLIISTLLGIAVGMIGLGIFFTLKQHDVTIYGFLNYLPLLSIGLITWCYSGGVGSQYLVLITELLDDKIRAIGSSMSMVAGSVSMFLQARYTLPILSALGSVATFFMFGVICLITTLFVFFFVPETKQMTIADIQRTLGGLKEDGEKKDCVTRF